MNKTVAILFSVICFLQAAAQDVTPQQYIEEYKDIAISEMRRMGVPAAITLAQGLMESQCGNSDLVKESNNHFGIKCKSTWTAETVSHDDDEPGECFRKYKTADDSYRDHSDFLRSGSRYTFLFQLNPSDYKDWAYGLQKAGYATNPRYPQILINNIEKYNLQQYTIEGMTEVPQVVATNLQVDMKSNSTPIASADSNVTKTTDLTINGLKALLVPKGTSLLAIAMQQHISLDKLLAINDLTNDGLLKRNQYIFLEKKKKVGDSQFYIAQANESIYDISQKNGVMLQCIYEYNGLTSDDFVTEGTKIFLKPINIAGSIQKTQSSKLSASSSKVDVQSLK
ncbi:MAG TPA: glucosaminidase domain-containing protein [Hanamia sp.]